jgi:hypothetical protein
MKDEKMTHQSEHGAAQNPGRDETPRPKKSPCTPKQTSLGTQKTHGVFGSNPQKPEL